MKPQPGRAVGNRHTSHGRSDRYRPATRPWPHAPPPPGSFHGAFRSSTAERAARRGASRLPGRGCGRRDPRSQGRPSWTAWAPGSPGRRGPRRPLRPSPAADGRPGRARAAGARLRRERRRARLAACGGHPDAGGVLRHRLPSGMPWNRENAMETAAFRGADGRRPHRPDAFTT